MRASALNRVGWFSDKLESACVHSTNVIAWWDLSRDQTRSVACITSRLGQLFIWPTRRLGAGLRRQTTNAFTTQQPRALNVDLTITRLLASAAVQHLQFVHGCGAIDCRDELCVRSRTDKKSCYSSHLHELPDADSERLRVKTAVVALSVLLVKFTKNNTTRY